MNCAQQNVYHIVHVPMMSLTVSWVTAMAVCDACRAECTCLHKAAGVSVARVYPLGKGGSPTLSEVESLSVVVVVVGDYHGTGADDERMISLQQATV